jgi:thiamine-phosphate diphosphorylase
MDPVQERKDVLALLTRVVDTLQDSLNDQLIPPRGAQIGYAIRGARDKGGVAAVGGRITIRNGKPGIGGPCAFGCDDEIARALITVMRFDSRRRSAALIRFSDRAIRVLEDDLFLECASYDPKKAPAGISTMDWGIASACRDEVPDVIFPLGPHDGDAVILILGEDPNDVANNIIICSNRI